MVGGLVGAVMSDKAAAVILMIIIDIRSVLTEQKMRNKVQNPKKVSGFRT